jgi:hypothetical protein
MKPEMAADRNVITAKRNQEINPMHQLRQEYALNQPPNGSSAALKISETRSRKPIPSTMRKDKNSCRTNAQRPDVSAGFTSQVRFERNAQFVEYSRGAEQKPDHSDGAGGNSRER